MRVKCRIYTAYKYIDVVINIFKDLAIWEQRET